MDPVGIVVATAGLFLAGVVKGTTGIGYATCALPFLTFMFGLKPAMALVLIPTFVTNLSLSFAAENLLPIARRFSPLYLAMAPGVVAGVLLLANLNQKTAVLVLGALMISYATIALAKPSYKLSAATESRLKIPVGFVGGILTGLTGSQVLPLVPYMMAVEMESDDTIQAINLGVLILTILLGVGLLTNRVMNPELIRWSAMAVAPALLGTYVGTRIRVHLPTSYVRSIVLTVVGLAGVKMLTG